MQQRRSNQKQSQQAPVQHADYTNDAFATISSSSIDELMKEVDSNNQQSQPRLTALSDMLPLLRMPQLTCRQVFLRLVFTKIGDIDTVRECFDASVYLEAQWREPTLDVGASAPSSDAASSDAGGTSIINWHPDLYIDNSIGDLMHRRERELTRNSSGEAFVLERHSLRGRFFERMELWHFPFDTQDITVTVCSNLPETAVELQEMHDKPSRVFTSTFTDEQEWSLHTHVEASRTSVISDSQIGPRQRPAVQFSTRATRRATFYVVNIWFVSFILCMLALCVFGIDRQNLQGRLQLSFILLLTTVTFKFVIANHIPRVSYLTMLDKAVMHNLIFLVVLSIWHSVASLFPATHPLQANEKFAIIAFAGVYVLGIAVIWLQIVFGALARKKLMDEKDLQYQVHLFSKAPQHLYASSD